MVLPSGHDPETSLLWAGYSSQLSYGSIRDSLEPQLATPLFCEKVEEKRRVSEQERGGNKCSSDVVNSDYKVLIIVSSCDFWCEMEGFEPS